MKNTEKYKLKERIKNANNKKKYIDIYKILIRDSNFKPSLNNNGVYFNLNVLDDNTLIKIDELLNDDIKAEVNEKLVYNSYYIETYADKLHNKLISLNI
jgi:hypothetical protein